MQQLFDFDIYIDFIKKYFNKEYNEKECNNEYMNYQL